MSRLLALVLAGSLRAAESDRHQQWRALVDAKDPKARELCEGWRAQSDKAARAEAHKCLASLAVAGGQTEAALAEVEAAIALSPGDLSAHEARLQIAEGAQRFSDLPGFLEKSLKAYPKPDGLEAWLDISAGLMDEERYEEGAAYMKVLEKRFPKDRRVISRLGSFLAAAKRGAEALPYLKRAVAISPQDAADNFSLGKLYDEMGDADLANRYLRRGVEFEKSPEQKREAGCVYAEFLKRRKRPKAEDYAKEHCPGGLPDED